MHPIPVAERRNEILQNFLPLDANPMWGTTKGCEEPENLAAMPTAEIYESQSVLMPVVAPQQSQHLMAPQQTEKIHASYT